MAKANRTTSKPRRANAAKTTKARRRHPVEWGYENGRQVVTHASGRAARELPVPRLGMLRDTIEDMGDLVKAFDGMRRIADKDLHLTMLAMTATVARNLMLEAAEDMRALLALSPDIRNALAQADAGAGKGGAK